MNKKQYRQRIINKLIENQIEYRKDYSYGDGENIAMQFTNCENSPDYIIEANLIFNEMDSYQLYVYYSSLAQDLVSHATHDELRRLNDIVHYFNKTVEMDGNFCITDSHDIAIETRISYDTDVENLYKLIFDYISLLDAMSPYIFSVFITVSTDNVLESLQDYHFDNYRLSNYTMPN